MMERKLFECGTVLVSEVAGFGRIWSSPFTSSGRLGISRRLSSSCQGIVVKASYSTARISSKSNGSVGQNSLFLGTETFRINKIYGTYPSSSTRESCVLDAYEDEYEGLLINPERLPLNANDFTSALRTSLYHWRLKGKKGVWLKLPVERSELVPVAVKEGFEYHHAERDYVMLTYWIPEGPSMLPSNASHQVGVGGFVINEKNEVLVVQEKYCASAFVGEWKLPTGFIVESEEIFEGAVREVKEETGIDTEFVDLIAFRHAHHVAFGKSDLFFVCMLRPLSTQIVVDGLEIQAAKWMPLVEFIEQPCIQGDSMFKKVTEICLARLGKLYCGLAAHQVISKFDGKSSSLYYNVVEAQDFNCKGD
ncbi:hypothetical protein AAC387_Pa01g3160 [Persea americana]